MKELIQIQKELKAPKNQYNAFGEYHYRSAEDILEALKPLLAKYDCILTLTDEIIFIGNRYYICAFATIKNSTGEQIVVKAFAREQESKTKMDASQITGAASSYARKYALNGLFLIDDTKDADATNTHGKEEVKEDNNGMIDEKITMDEINSAKSTEELRLIWEGLSEEGRQYFKDAIKRKKEELIKKSAK